MDGGAYTSEARSWSNTPPCAVHRGQDMVAVFAKVGGGGRLPIIGELRSVGALVTRETSRGTPLITPLIKTITSWGPGQVRRKVSHGHKI